MKRFRFTLEPALRLRRRTEEQAQLALAEADRQLAREWTQLKELQRDLERHQHSTLARAVDVQALRDADRYRQSLMVTILRQQEAVRAATAAVAAAREELKARRTDREALEEIRERQLAEHKLEVLKEEQASLDEFAVLRWSGA